MDVRWCGDYAQRAFFVNKKKGEPRERLPFF